MMADTWIKRVHPSREPPQYLSSGSRDYAFLTDLIHLAVVSIVTQGEEFDNACRGGSRKF